MSSLQKYIDDRAELELLYAQRLTAISSKLSASNWEAEGVCSVVNSIRQSTERRAAHATELASSLRADILQQTLTTTIANHHSVARHISNDAQSLGRTLDSLRMDVQAAEKEVAVLGRQCYQQATDSLRPEQWGCNAHTRMTLRWIGRAKELANQQKRYSKLCRTYNEAVSNYRRQMRNILDSLQDMDTKRLNCVHDTLMRMLVFELSAIRNIQYDTEQVVKVVETLTPSEEIRSFLRKAGGTHEVTDVKELHWAELYLRPEREGSSPRRKQRDRDEGATGLARTFLRQGGISAYVQTAAAHLGITPLELLNENEPVTSRHGPPLEHYRGTNTNEALQWLAATPTVDPNSKSQQALQRLQAEYLDHLNLIWNFLPENSRQVSAVVNKCKNELPAFLQRTLFLRALALKDENGENELPSMDALFILAQLLETSLISASEQSDSCNLRTMIVLVQRFYARGMVADDPSKVMQTWQWPHATKQKTPPETLEAPAETELWFVHRALYHMGMWGHVRMWEETLLYSIGYEQQLKLLQQTETAVAGRLSDSGTSESQSKMPHLYSQLVSRFAEVMVAFGITNEAATGLIRRVLERHSLLSEYPQCLDDSSLPKRGDLIYLPLSPMRAVACPMVAVPPPTAAAPEDSKKSSDSVLERKGESDEKHR